MKQIVVIVLSAFLLISCAETEKDKITRLVREMEGKEIVFPDDIVYTVYGTDTVNYVMPEREYTIVSYIDSIGCTSCKLQLHRWKEFMSEMDSLSGNSVSFRFIFHPKDKKELNYLFKRDKFNIPVWIDDSDDFSRMNKLPELDAFHTFLLNSEDKVMAIGNPVNNLKIKELYHQLVLPPTESLEATNSLVTQIEIEESVIDMGEFDWREPRERTVRIKNTGSNMLVISDIVTSCGCISIIYSKEPVSPCNDMKIRIIYKADYPEFFNKTLKLYANLDINPLVMTVKGVSR